MAKFLQYSLGLFIHPQSTLRLLALARQWVLFGFFGQLMLAIVNFTGISIALASKVMPVPNLIVLNIPASQYYSYERLFILFVPLAGTILTSGVIRLIAHLWSGNDQYENLFALLGFGLIVIAVVMGLPDLIIGLHTGMGIIAPLGFNFIGPHGWPRILWYLFIIILTIREVERLPWGISVLLAAIGFAANGLVQFIFIR